jgi:hypothetical protein
VLQTEPPASLLFMTQPCWYVDVERGEAGTIDAPWPAQSLTAFLSMPPISPSELAVVATVVQEVAPQMPMPASHHAHVPTIDAEPVPVLRLETKRIAVYDYRFNISDEGLDFAVLHFDYGGVRLEAGNTRSLARNALDETVYVKRRPGEVQKAAKTLQQYGLRKIPRQNMYGHGAHRRQCGCRQVFSRGDRGAVRIDLIRTWTVR